jgi:Tol biopolymer transport system component
MDAGSGHLLWLRERTLFAQGFDPARLRLSGEAEAVVQDVAINTLRRAAFWASDGGVLVYRSGEAFLHQIEWSRRDGKGTGQVVTGANAGGALRLSPHADRVAFSRIAGETGLNIWVLEFSRSVLTRLTYGASSDYGEVWSSDGHEIAFSSDRAGVYQIYRKNADGAGSEEQLTSGPNDKHVTDWSRDGKWLLYSQDDPRGVPSLWALPLEGDRRPVALVQTPFLGVKGQFSPDGKWIAFDSNSSGGFEVYVRGFPPSVRQVQISNRGGTDPRWRGDGKELFYLSPSKTMMAVTIRTSGASIEADTPRKLFPARVSNSINHAPYDVTADGERFLLAEAIAGPSGAQPLTVVVNWEAGLKR